MHRVIIALILQQARSPIPWAALLIAGIAWPLSLQYSPLSLTLNTGSSRELSYELAFLFCLAGAIYADRVLEGMKWLLARPANLVASSTRMVALSAGALLPASMCIAPLLILGGGDPLTAFVALALSSVHVASILHLLNCATFSAPARSVGLLFSAFVIPACTPSNAGLFNFPWLLLNPLPVGLQDGLNGTLLSFQLGAIVVLIMIASAIRLSLSR